MLEYFASHYSWNLGVMMAAQLGGELTEIDGACRPLRAFADRPDAKDDPEAQAAWISAWSSLAQRVEGFALRDEARRASMVGRSQVSARLRLLVHRRAYDQSQVAAEARAVCGDDAVLRKERHAARRADRIRRRFPMRARRCLRCCHRAPQAGPRPAMIHFDGFDVTKEWMSPVRHRATSSPSAASRR